MNRNFEGTWMMDLFYSLLLLILLFRRPRRGPKEPLARTVAGKLTQAEIELALLKDQLDQATSKFNREMNRSAKKLKTAVGSLGRQQDEKELALMQAVSQMVCLYFLSMYN